ncbi:MAG: multidrug efflux SMR transporter [Myxococcales bacterium]|nr:multidrug efflux SMR transporter [Myxococcales bacterium]
MSRPWLLLVLAGLLEVCWAIGLKKSEGFSRPLASAATLAAMALSMWLLAAATRALPIGTAYAVWVGIGALGAAVLGVLVLGEPLSGPRALFLGLLVVSIVGLKLTSPEAPAGIARPAPHDPGGR